MVISIYESFFNSFEAFVSGIYRSAQFNEIITEYLKTGFCDLIYSEIQAIYHGPYPFKNKAVFFVKVLSLV